MSGPRRAAPTSRLTPRGVGLALLALAVAPAAGRAQTVALAPSSVFLATAAWSDPSPAGPRSAARPAAPSQESRSAVRAIGTHALVGTGAGLLVGLLLSGTNVVDDDGAVVLTWTGVGLAAGVASGVATWLLDGG